MNFDAAALEEMVNQRGGGGDSVVANHRSAGRNLVIVTTIQTGIETVYLLHNHHQCKCTVSTCDILSQKLLVGTQTEKLSRAWNVYSWLSVGVQQSVLGCF